MFRKRKNEEDFLEVVAEQLQALSSRIRRIEESLEIIKQHLQDRVDTDEDADVAAVGPPSAMRLRL